MASGKRVLVADDNLSELGTMRAVLQEAGFDVVAVAARVELYEALESTPVDVLLLSISMAGASDLQLLKELKSDRRWSDTPVMMVSDLATDDVTELTFGLGAADFLRRPLGPRELVARVQAQLRLQRMLSMSKHALVRAEEEMVRAREDAESRRKVVDILHEVTGDLTSDEIYHILARRVARTLKLSRCSVILAKPGDTVGVVATAFDNPSLRNFEIHLDRYPEIMAALAHGTPVLVEDVQSNPLYVDIRREWASNGTQVPVRSVIALPFTIGTVQAGVFFLRRMVDEEPLTKEDVAFADSVIKAAVAAIHRAQLIETTKADNARLEVLAHTDPLTQVLNRRALTARLAAELERARRYDSSVSLLMVDLDHFKRINDTLGHLAGDDMLREIAAMLQESIRSVDVVARYGGEEFVVVLPETNAAGAVAFAERLRERIASMIFAEAYGGARVTVSIGVAAYTAPGVPSIDALFGLADEALYRAKADGRNKVCQ
ncbi:MAG: diguanylate cyclase [Gemmatimonadetes bacterium]|nr:diguanylate cyclase [Gemmatimonadota bacterium]